MASDKLTTKQALFVDEYLVDGNATGAAKRSGYSEKTSHAIGQENLKKPIIADAIRKAQEERNGRVLITQEDVINNIIRLAQKSEDAGEMNNALRAAELLGKTMAMFTDKQETTGANGGAIETNVTVEFINASPKSK